MRFVRPALVVEGRKVLATLEHKPWAAGDDGAWIAAFPWKDAAAPDAGTVTLAVAPSVEVALDGEAPPAAEAPAEAEAEVPAPGPVGAAGEIRPLRDELRMLERRLDEMRDELHETRAIAAEREARCRELERAASRERHATDEAGAGAGEIMRSQAMALLDRDRAVAQLEEAVVDREAAVRTHKRMQAQRDEARRQRDDVLLAHRELQEQRSGERGTAREDGVTTYDMWVMRVLGGVAALAFVSLLVMILKALFAI
jgi:hypothetical protein